MKDETQRRFFFGIILAGVVLILAMVTYCDGYLESKPGTVASHGELIKLVIK